MSRRRRWSLGREIAAVLLLKIAAVMGLYHLFFDEPVVATEASWLAPVSADAHTREPLRRDHD